MSNMREICHSCISAKIERRQRISKIVIVRIAVLFFLLSNVDIAVAEEKITYTATAKFLAGVASAALIHEGAHALVAGITGTHMSWKLGNYNQPISFTESAESDSKGVAVYSAGLISQALASEVILDVDKIDKNDAFVRGMMAWNIINPILYALDYWVIHSSNKEDGNTYQGDMKGIEHYSRASTANVFAAGIVAIVTFQGYRFLKTQTWAPDWLKSNIHEIKLAPQPEGGFVMSYEFRF
ncbi:MAG TPA: hypothetical protein VMT12_09020 [Syntrophales bacterium]|nr:hypothetical protein [Syntrophales bacterium]